MKTTTLAAVILTAAILAACGTIQQAATNKEVEETVVEQTEKKPETFTYTEKPTLEMIPDKPIEGEVNGEPFTVETVLFQPSYTGNWEVSLIEKKLDDPLAVLFESQYFNLDLNKKPETGAVITHPMEFGDGICQIKQLDNPEETTSWNSPNAWVMEITEWDVKPWDPEGDIFQVAGTASGTIAVCFQGSCGYANSWVAGTFSGAIVRYMGEPELND